MENENRADNNANNAGTETSLCLPETLEGRTMEEECKEMWVKLSCKDRRKSVLKLLQELFEWAFETITFLATLFFMIISRKDNIEAGRADDNDLLQTGIVHVISCIIRLFIDLSAPNAHRMHDKRSTTREKLRSFYRFVANLFMVLKPYRDFQNYRFYQRQSRPVRQHLILQKPLTKQVIESVVAMNHKDLLDESYKVTDVFIKTVPMNLLQLYILFQNNQSFQLCSRTDVSRLFMFLNCIGSSAMCVSMYNRAYNYYVKSLHFQYFFETGHPINTCLQTWVTFGFTYLCNVFLILHRFFGISFFLAVSEVLTVVYIITLWFTQFLMLLMFPSLRVPFENPPFGAPTILSEIIDRWVNMFTNHMTKFTWMTVKSYKILSCEFRLPLCLLQLIPFFISIGTVFCLSYAIGDDWEHYQLLRSVKRRPIIDNITFTNSNDSISIPCLNYTIQGLPHWVAAISEFLFQIHHSLSNRFLSFKDLFGVLYFLPGSMYFYIACSLAYSYYMSIFYLNDPMYPVKRGYEFWHYLMHELSKGGKNSASPTQLLRSLMVLTIIDDSELYNLYKRSLCSCYNPFYKTKASILAKSVVKVVTETRSEIREKLQEVFQVEHPLREDFKLILNKITENNNPADRDINEKLFLLFYSKFDNRIRDMTSFRISCMFSILKVTLNKLSLN